jgi:hypothetical protein
MGSTDHGESAELTDPEHGRLACRRVAVNSGVELTTGVEISIAAA